MVMMTMITRMVAYVRSGEVMAHHDHDTIPVSFRTRNTRVSPAVTATPDRNDLISGFIANLWFMSSRPGHNRNRGGLVYHIVKPRPTVGIACGPEAVSFAIHGYFRNPSETIDGLCASDKFCRTPPLVGHLRIYGAVSFSHASCQSNRVRTQTSLSAFLTFFTAVAK